MKQYQKMPTDGNHDAFPCQGGQQGITKLEYFAAIAMQGLLAQDVGNEKLDVSCVAFMAVEQAKALISQLNQDK